MRAWTKGLVSCATAGLLLGSAVANAAAPIANPDTVTTPAGVAVTIPVTANDSDPDGNAFSISSFRARPANGSVTRSTRAITYTPKAGFSGVDTFVYRIKDSTNLTANAQVTVTVSAPVNTAPLAGADSASTVSPNPVTINLLTNDTDANGDTLSVTANTAPTNGTVTRTGGSATYTPAAGFSGSDSFGYTLSDGNGGTATGTVTLSVAPPPNVAPVAGADSASTVSPNAVTINLLANDTDANGDTLSVTANTAPTNGTVTRTGGSATYTPAAGFSGSDSFGYTLSDGNGGTATGTVTVSVAPPPNVAPVAGADSASTVSPNPVTINLLANDTDANGDTLSVTANTAPANGTVTRTGGSATYTPAAGFSGSDSFGYTLSDGNGGTATGTVTVSVSAAPAPASAAANSAVLSWSIPTTRADGSPIAVSEIAGYEIYVLAEGTGVSSVITVTGGTTTTYTVMGLSPDTYDFSMAAKDTAGNLSALSPVVAKIIAP